MEYSVDEVFLLTRYIIRKKMCMILLCSLETFILPSSKLEEELERRKELGFNFVQVLQQQNKIFIKDEDEREKHQVTFMSTAREITRLLKEISEMKNNNNNNNNDDEMMDDFIFDNEEVQKK